MAATVAAVLHFGARVSLVLGLALSAGGCSRDPAVCDSLTVAAWQAGFSEVRGETLTLHSDGTVLEGYQPTGRAVSRTDVARLGRAVAATGFWGDVAQTVCGPDEGVVGQPRTHVPFLRIVAHRDGRVREMTLWPVDPGGELAALQAGWWTFYRDFSATLGGDETHPQAARRFPIPFSERAVAAVSSSTLPACETDESDQMRDQSRR
jgi:hypothetical protein